MRDDAPVAPGGDLPRYIFATPLWALLVLATGLALTGREFWELNNPSDVPKLEAMMQRMGIA